MSEVPLYIVGERNVCLLEIETRMVADHACSREGLARSLSLLVSKPRTMMILSEVRIRNKRSWSASRG